MLTKIVEYYSDEVLARHTDVTRDTVSKALVLAKKEKAIIKLLWYVPYNGWHNVLISKDDDIEDILNKIPRIYGV